jgi:hypothetical protein
MPGARSNTMNSRGASGICRIGTLAREERAPTKSGCDWVLIRLGTAMVPSFYAARFHDSGRIFRPLDIRRTLQGDHL